LNALNPARTGGLVSIAGLQHYPRQRIGRSGETVTEPLIGIQADVETNNRIKILSNGSPTMALLARWMKLLAEFFNPAFWTLEGMKAHFFQI